MKMYMDNEFRASYIFQQIQIKIYLYITILTMKNPYGDIRKIKRENQKKFICSQKAWRRCIDCQDKCLKKISQLILVAVLTILANVFFQFSLKGCPPHLKQVECIEWFNQQAGYIGAFLLLTGLCYSSLIIIVLLRVVSVWYIYVFGFNMLYLFQVSDRANFWDHSQYNFQILAVFLTPVVLTQLCLIGWTYFGMKRWKLALLTFFILHLFIPTLFYYSVAYKSCEGDWKRGLKNSMMINGKNEPYCLFNEPQDCWCKVLDGVSDLSWFRSCNTQYGSLQQNKQYYGDCDYVGIPNYKHLLTEQDLKVDKFFLFAKHHYICVSQKQFKNKGQAAFGDSDVYIDFYTNRRKPKIHIKVQKSQTLAQEANQRRQQYLQELKRKNVTLSKNVPQNVVILFIDALPRNQFRRKMPKSFKWLQDYYKNEQSEAESFQFFRFIPFPGGVTLTSFIALQNALTIQDHDKPNTHFLNAYKKAGFISGYSNQNCAWHEYRRDQDETVTLQADAHYYDHNINGIFCNPSYYSSRDSYHLLTGQNSVMRRCIFGRDAFQYNFDFGKDFMMAYPQNKKVLKLVFNQAHQATGDLVRIIDEDFYQFLEFLRRENFLKNTAISIFADHGMHDGGLYLFMPEDFLLQKHLPVLFFVFPRDYSNEIRDTLIYNQQPLMGNYDFHQTLWSMQMGQKSTNQSDGRNVLEEKLDLSRGVVKRGCLSQAKERRLFSQNVNHWDEISAQFFYL